MALRVGSCSGGRIAVEVCVCVCVRVISVCESLNLHLPRPHYKITNPTSCLPVSPWFPVCPSDHDVTVRVRRSKGSKGTVRVFYSTTSFVERLPFLPANTPRAKENLDFLPQDNYLDFPEGMSGIEDSSKA